MSSRKNAKVYRSRQWKGIVICIPCAVESNRLVRISRQIVCGLARREVSRSRPITVVRALRPRALYQTVIMLIRSRSLNIKNLLKTASIGVQLKA